MTAPLYPRPALLNPDDRDRHLVIEASAGTGKTWTIEHIVAGLVLEEGVPIDAILVVTFTKKAAAELKKRIRTLLETLLRLANEEIALEDPPGPDDPSWILDGRAQERLKTALAGFDAATVATIHAFASGVMREVAFEGGLPFDVEPSSSDSLLEMVWRDTVRDTLTTDPLLQPWLQATRRSGTRLGTIQGLVTKLVRDRTPLLKPFDEANFRLALTDLGRHLEPHDDKKALTEILKRGWSEKPGRGPSTSAGHLIKIRDLLSAVDADAHAADLLAALPMDVLQKPLGYLEEKEQLDADHDPVVQEILSALRRLTYLAAPVVQPLVEALVPIVATRFRETKRALGIVDHDDLLQLLDEACAREPQVAAAIRTRFTHALIDEFQDTDPVQWSIFERVFATNDGGRLIVVGDPKQAIYRFRGADLGTYRRAVEALEKAGARRLTLDRNFRSTARLVDAVNLLIEQDADDSIFTGHNRYPVPVRSVHEQSRRVLDADGTPRAPLGLLSILEEGWEGSTEDARADLARLIAAEIRRAVHEDRLETDEGLRPLRYRDFDLLVRKKADTEPLLEALEVAGVPAALFGSGDIYQSDEARDLRDLLEAIEAPHDPDRRLRAWLGPYFDLDVRDLPATRDLAREHPLLARLQRWHDLAERRRWEELLEAIFSESGFARRARLSDEGERSLRKARQMGGQLVSGARLAGEDLRGMIARLQEREEKRDEDMDEGDNQELFDVDRDFVRILTMHKSKGLEAPIVFIAGGLGPQDSQSEPLRVIDTEEGRFAIIGKSEEIDVGHKALFEQARREEQERLIYVALTRPCSRLYLPHLPPDQKKIGAGGLKPLVSRLRALDDAGDPAFADLAAFVSTPPPGEKKTRRPDGTKRADLVLAPDEDFRSSESTPVFPGRLITSYSALKKALSRNEEHQDFDDEVGVAPSAPSELDPILPPGRRAGLFLHELMETIDPAPLLSRPDFDTWKDDPQVVSLGDRAAARWGFDDAAQRRGLMLCHQTLTMDLPLGDRSLRPLAGMQSARPELEFVLPLPDANLPRLGEAWRAPERFDAGLLTGAIDLVFAAEERVYLLDWKSDLLADDSPEAIATRVRDEYRLQARIYALALARVLGLRDSDDHQQRFGGVVYVFLRHRHAADPARGVWFQRPSWSDLGETEASLEELSSQGLAR